MYGETVDEVVSAFRADNDPAFVQQTVQDIERFLTIQPEDETELTSNFRRVFEPEISFYCWEGRTVRETLLHIVEVLTR